MPGARVDVVPAAVSGSGDPAAVARPDPLRRLAHPLAHSARLAVSRRARRRRDRDGCMLDQLPLSLWRVMDPPRLGGRRARIAQATAARPIVILLGVCLAKAGAWQDSMSTGRASSPTTVHGSTCTASRWPTRHFSAPRPGNTSNRHTEAPTRFGVSSSTGPGSHSCQSVSLLAHGSVPIVLDPCRGNSRSSMRPHEHVELLMSSG